jgi:hypothetical protein
MDLAWNVFTWVFSQLLELYMPSIAHKRWWNVSSFLSLVLAFQILLIFVMSNNIGKNLHIYIFNIDEYDTMATTMIYHFLEAWEHVQFNQLLLSKFQMWNFTTELHTFILRGTLGSSMTYSMFLVVWVDDTCVANMMHNVEHLPLVQPYMVVVQNTNNSVMNEAINGFYLEEEDYD